MGAPAALSARGNPTHLSPKGGRPVNHDSDEYDRHQHPHRDQDPGLASATAAPVLGSPIDGTVRPGEATLWMVAARPLHVLGHLAVLGVS
jgi:hypothetical protein